MSFKSTVPQHPNFLDRGPESLFAVASELLDRTYAMGTLATYTTAARSFITFARHHGLLKRVEGGFELADVTAIVMIYYLAWCYKTKLKFNTITTYVAGVRAWIQAQGKADPVITDTKVDPAFYMAMRGLKRIHKGPKADRFPVTTWILSELLRVSKSRLVLTKYQALNLRACCLLMWFGLLRVSEATQATAKRGPLRTAVRGDVHFHPNRMDCQYVTFLVKCSKADQFREGFTLTLYRSGKPEMCAVTALLDLFEADPQPDTSPLFDFHVSGPPEPQRVATRSTFIKLVKKCLEAADIDDRNIKSHSFRQGGASALAATAQGHYVRVMGRWASDCWHAYISVPLSAVKTFAYNMANQPCTPGVQTDYIAFQ